MKWISEALFSKDTYNILNVEYKRYLMNWMYYVLMEPFNLRWLLRTPGWEQVYEIIYLDLVTKDWNLPVFKFRYYDWNQKIWEICVFTDNWRDFIPLWNSQVVDKTKETPIQKEVWNRKWLIWRIVDKIPHRKK